MIVTINPSAISGSIQAPASKSSMQRACAAALLHRGESHIHQPGYSNDDQAAVELIRQMGATVRFEKNKLVITGNGLKPAGNEVTCGESGLGIRMFTPIIAMSDKEMIITGEGSLLQRPMDFFDDILPQLGVTNHSASGKLPLKIKGPLQPRNIEIDGSLSSQFLTGLLMAYSASGARDVSIKVNNLKSRPYIDLTLEVMRQFGLNMPENKDYQEFYFPAVIANSRLQIVDYHVEGDWSGGAFLLVAGAIAGTVVVEGLDISSTQADKAILTALKQAGASLSVQSNRIKAGTALGKLTAFHFDATECPDLFPPLVALASYCHGRTIIKGATRLTHKESNRSITLQREFGKMGTTIEIEDDLMIVQGGAGLTGNTVHSHHDHRIAMACAVAALKAVGKTIIEEAEAIAKSYPDFYLNMQQLGASVILPRSAFEVMNNNKINNLE